MPETTVVFYQAGDGTVPVLEWFDELRARDRRAYARCQARVTLLARMGHELRRPHADLLRDGVYELRIRTGTVNYRVLYFFHGREAVVLAHGLTKQDKVPAAEIDRAVRRKQSFERDPIAHTYHEG